MHLIHDECQSCHPLHNESEGDNQLSHNELCSADHAEGFTIPEVCGFSASVSSCPELFATGRWVLEICRPVPEYSAEEFSSMELLPPPLFDCETKSEMLSMRTRCRDTTKRPNHSTCSLKGRVQAKRVLSAKPPRHCQNEHLLHSGPLLFLTGSCQ